MVGIVESTEDTDVVHVSSLATMVFSSSSALSNDKSQDHQQKFSLALI